MTDQNVFVQSSSQNTTQHASDLFFLHAVWSASVSDFFLAFTLINRIY